MRQAAKRDSNEKEIVDGLRAAGRAVARLSDPGIPDLLVAFNGRNYLLEVKVPGGKLKPLQVKFFQEWPGPKAIVETLEEALAFTS